MQISNITVVSFDTFLFTSTSMQPYCKRTLILCYKTLFIHKVNNRLINKIITDLEATLVSELLLVA